MNNDLKDKYDRLDMLSEDHSDFDDYYEPTDWVAIGLGIALLVAVTVVIMVVISLVFAYGNYIKI